MAQETDLNITKFGSTYSATKQEALKSAIQNNALDTEEVFTLMRRAGQGFGLGTGLITGTDASTAVVGVGTLFSSELVVGDEIYITGVGVVEISSIGDDTNLVLTGNPDANFTDAQYTFNTPPA